MSEYFAEKIERLESLNEREAYVLDRIMANPDVKIREISDELRMGESTIRLDLTNIYKKLGVPSGERDQRGYVVREYAEAYRERYLKVNNSTFRNDERKEGININPPEPRVRPHFRIIAVLVGFLIISLVVICVLLSIIRNLNRPAPVQATSERPTEAQVVVQPTDTQVQVFQPTQPAPTQPEPTLPPVVIVEPTDTPTLIPTAQPTPLPPAIPLPFSDSMTTGFSSAWKVLSGNWISADGKTTITDEGYDWGTIVLDDPRWVNYKINFTVKSFNGSLDEIVVYLRYQSDQTKFLVYDLSAHFYGGNFAYFDGYDVERITDVRNIGHLPESYNVEIIVNGNTYTAKIDGQQLQTITVSGYGSGGVGIGISCSFRPCTGIADFTVTGQ